MAIDLGYDESGTGDTLLVTVQLSMTEQAKKLRRKWRRATDEAHIRFFHSKDFGNYSGGVFAHLSRAERASLLDTLSKFSRQHISIGMTAKVTKSVYESKTTPEFRSKWGTAYTFAIQQLLVAAYLFAEHCRMKPEFNILIEDGHRNAGQALCTLNDMKQRGDVFPTPSRVLTVGLGSKSDHPILEAADMLGYSEWQKLSGKDDLSIYGAMHAPMMRYRPEFIDLDTEMVDVTVENARRWLAGRNAWGLNHPASAGW